MRYSDMRNLIQERSALLGKKRLGKNQKARLATLAAQLDEARQPPPTPAVPNTGQDYDRKGNTYAMHTGTVTLREARRGNKFGLGTARPLRSRVTRTRRKQRTGGVK